MVLRCVISFHADILHQNLINPRSVTSIATTVTAATIASIVTTATGVTRVPASINIRPYQSRVFGRQCFIRGIRPIPPAIVIGIEQVETEHLSTIIRPRLDVGIPTLRSEPTAGLWYVKQLSSSLADLFILGDLVLATKMRPVCDEVLVVSAVLVLVREWLGTMDPAQFDPVHAGIRLRGEPGFCIVESNTFGHGLCCRYECGLRRDDRPTILHPFLIRRDVGIQQPAACEMELRDRPGVEREAPDMFRQVAIVAC